MIARQVVARPLVVGPQQPPAVYYVKGPLSRVTSKVRRLSDFDMQAEIKATDRFLAELTAARHRDWLDSLPPGQRASAERVDRFRKDAEVDATVARLRDRRQRDALERHRRIAEQDRAMARGRERRAADEMARARAERHRKDQEAARVVAKLRRLR